MPRPLDLLPPLFEGLLVTVGLTVGAAAVALFCAFAGGLASRSTDPLIRGFARTYVEVFRGTSALVQLFWFFYALPLLLGISLEPIPTGILVLGLNIGAYGAEVVRGAIQAVPRAQSEAAAVLDFTPWQQYRHIVLPQAIVSMLPPFGNLLIELIKSTALVSLITLTELTRAGMFLRDQTLREGEIFGLLLVLYFGVAQVSVLLVRALERRLSHSGPQGGSA